MASQKILEKKQKNVEQFADVIQNSTSLVVVDARGVTVSQMTEIRRGLREVGADIKVFKNTLAKLALNKLNYDIDSHLEGPSAFAYGDDAIAPIKVLDKFAKDIEALEIKVGIIDGNITDIQELSKLATIPSREGLLTMLAGGMIGIPRDLSICLDLYSQKLEEGGN